MTTVGIISRLPALSNSRGWALLALGVLQIGVLAYMGLERDRFTSSGDAPAIDKAFYDVAHLGHVRVRRYIVAIGQNKSRESVWIFFESGTEIRKFHVASICLLRNIINSAHHEVEKPAGSRTNNWAGLMGSPKKGLFLSVPFHIQTVCPDAPFFSSPRKRMSIWRDARSRWRRGRC